VISRKGLVSALRDRRVADWVVIERAQELATVSDQRRRNEARTRFTVVLHADTTTGRGSARLDVAALAGSSREAIDQALALAMSAVGPSWRSAPPAAPAKVALLDPALDKGSLETLGAELLTSLPRPSGVTVTGELELLRERVAAQTQAGLHSEWSASQVRATILVANDAFSFEVTREARRLEDLGLAAAITDAATDLAQLAAATAPTPGPCAVILGPEALLHRGGLGAWVVFANHATAELERQGLVRYRLGAPIVAGADSQPEPLTVTSDGALDFATRSVPLGDEGDAVRRFALVERGIAVGLGMSMREAARRGTDPNGGVRNLVVASGSWTEAPPAGRTLDIRRLRSLAIDPHTGDASLEIALAIEHDGGKQRAVTGGELLLDLVGVLALAKRSAVPLRRGPYLGPRAILIERAELLA